MILPSRRMTHFGFMDDYDKSYQFERCVWTSSSKVVSENDSSWMICGKTFTQTCELDYQPEPMKRDDLKEIPNFHDDQRYMYGSIDTI